MARVSGIFRRGPDSEDEGSREPESGNPAPTTPQKSAEEPQQVGRFKAWLGYGPEPEPEEKPESQPESREPATALQARADPGPSPATEEWRILENGPGAPKDESNGSEEDLTASEPSATNEPPKPTTPPARDDTETLVRMAAIEEKLEREMSEAAAKLAELEERISRAEKRTRAAEREAQEARERAAELDGEDHVAAATAEPATESEPEPPTPSTPDGAEPRLSEATVDDLRGLGLSTTQAKRVVDFRERLGGFDSVDDLDYVPGLSKQLLSELKSKVTL